jgi:hypothetical protein
MIIHEVESLEVPIILPALLNMDVYGMLACLFSSENLF